MPNPSGFSDILKQHLSCTKQESTAFRAVCPPNRQSIRAQKRLFLKGQAGIHLSPYAAFLCRGSYRQNRCCPLCLLGFGVMDKIGVKNRCSPYAARLYARSKPLNTKNAFSAAPNRSGKMAPKMANNATDVCPVTSVSAAGKAKSQHPLAALQRRQAKRRTACRAVRMQHQSDPSPPQQSRYTGRMRAATDTREPHMDTTPISATSGASWSSTTLAASAP